MGLAYGGRLQGHGGGSTAPPRPRLSREVVEGRAIGWGSEVDSRTQPLPRRRVFWGEAGRWAQNSMAGPARSCRAGRRATPRSPTRRRRSSRVGGPAQLDNGKWGAGLEGPRVAELPKNNRLPGTPIRVTDRTDQSWTTTLTEVVDRTDTTIVVKNSGRPRS